MTVAATAAASRPPAWRRGIVYVPPLLVAGWAFERLFRRMTESGDFPAHMKFAQEIAQTGRVTIPHFGYELGIIVVHALQPDAGWPAATFLVSYVGQLVTVALLASWMAHSVPESRPALRLVVALLVPMALLFAQPVLPLGPMARDPWLIGFFPPNQYHNPTTLLSKPIALALFGFGVTAAFGGGPVAGGVGACAALVVASGLVKPSFLMAFLPAVGLCALGQWRRARWGLLIAGLALPAVLLLSWQFVLRYRLQSNDGVSIVWDPLMVIGLYVPTDAYSLLSRLLASILFPVAVTLCFARQAVRDHRMVLAWATLAAGVSYGYLLAEAGGKASAGDFLWSGQIAVFLLFAVCASFLLRQATGLGGSLRTGVLGKAAFCALILGWHVASGAQYLRTSWFD